MKKQTIFLFFSVVSTLLFSQSTVETHSFFSSALGIEKSYKIYLPDGYDTNIGEFYPTVYFLRLHETEWFNPQWRNDGKTLKDLADDLIESGTIGKMILIGPSTGGDNSNLNVLAGFAIINMLRPDLSTVGGIGSGAFEDYFFQDLIPHIDSTFRTIPKWCARGVDGFSLGGFTSTLFSLKHPGVFSSVGSYDGTIMWYDLDYPATSGALDDNRWLVPGLENVFAPMFDFPFDIDYMKAHSATNILAEIDQTTLDSIQQISFHIQAGAFNNSTNKEVNEQFVDALAANGISNSFNNLVLAPNAIHSFDWGR